MALDTELKNKIETIVASDRVVLFMKGTKERPQCGFSATVTGLLSQLVPSYTTVDVLSDENIRGGIKEFSSWPTIPQLYVNKEFIGGCDIIKELFDNGEIFDVLSLPKPGSKIPEVKISASALEAFQGALTDLQPGEFIKLKISPKFVYELTFGPKNPNDIEVKQGDFTLLIDPMSCLRADGITINYTTNNHGAGFEIDNPNAKAAVKEMTVTELRKKLDNDEALHLFDVRTQEEWDTSHIKEATLMLKIPQAELDTIDKNAPIVMQCRSGSRSLRVAQQFCDKGFRNVYNLVGGIRAYAKEIDTTLVVN